MTHHGGAGVSLVPNQVCQPGILWATWGHQVRGKFVTLVWAELLPGRSEAPLRLAVMRALARLKANGIPILRRSTRPNICQSGWPGKALWKRRRHPRTMKRMVGQRLAYVRSSVWPGIAFCPRACLPPCGPWLLDHFGNAPGGMQWHNQYLLKVCASSEQGVV